MHALGWWLLVTASVACDWGSSRLARAYWHPLNDLGSLRYYRAIWGLIVTPNWHQLGLFNQMLLSQKPLIPTTWPLLGETAYLDILPISTSYPFYTETKEGLIKLNSRDPSLCLLCGPHLKVMTQVYTGVAQDVIFLQDLKHGVLKEHPLPWAVLIYLTLFCVRFQGKKGKNWDTYVCDTNSVFSLSSISHNLKLPRKWWQSPPNMHILLLHSC